MFFSSILLVNKSLPANINLNNVRLICKNFTQILICQQRCLLQIPMTFLRMESAMGYLHWQCCRDIIFMYLHISKKKPPPPSTCNHLFLLITIKSVVSKVHLTHNLDWILDHLVHGCYALLISGAHQLLIVNSCVLFTDVKFRKWGRRPLSLNFGSGCGTFAGMAWNAPKNLCLQI